jgi:hypothetical protein
MKAVLFVLVGLATFGVLFAIFLTISLPVLKIVPPEASIIVWLVVFGAPAVCTAAALRMTYDVMKRK